MFFALYKEIDSYRPEGPGRGREGGRRNGATGDRGTYWATGHDPRREVFDSLVLLYVEYKQKMGSLSVSAPQH